MRSTAIFSVAKARKAQIGMAKKIMTQDQLPKQIRSIGGVDVAYTQNLAIGASVVLDYESLEVAETQIAIRDIKFPYVPTLFSFRELPVATAAIIKLKRQPEVLLVDGHGRAHPYRCGLASHLGLILRRPTIGVAKSRLVGEVKRIGRNVFLVDNNEIISAVIPVHSDTKPVYVSVGHRVSLDTAIEIVKHCIRRGILEPINTAHVVAQKWKNKICNQRIGVRVPPY